MLTLMSKEKLNFLLQIQILLFKYEWNLPSLSLAWFFLIQNELRTMWIYYQLSKLFSKMVKVFDDMNEIKRIFKPR